MSNKRADTEIWKSFPLDSDYDVSNRGRVRSYKTTSKRKKRRARPKLLKLCKRMNGYIHTVLTLSGVGQSYSVHRLVLTTFIGPSKLHCNHKNGIKTDNRLENLEWVTRSENALHAFRTGLIVSIKGEDHPLAKLDEKTARKIKYDTGTGAEISRKYGVKQGTVYCIRAGKTWKHI